MIATTEPGSPPHPWGRNPGSFDVVPRGDHREALANFSLRLAARQAHSYIYIHADLALKERTLARTTPAGVRPAAIDPRTGSWPFSKASDSADGLGADAACDRGACADIGIIRTSA